MKKSILIIPLFLLLSFTVGDNRSVYIIPHSAGPVCASDLDLDGDMDIIISAQANGNTQWGGLYLMLNDGNGNFHYKDSIFLLTGQKDVFVDYVFSNTYPDIVCANNSQVHILSFNGEEYTQQSFDMGNRISEFAIGDIDNDNDLDVVFCSGINYCWGILHNLNKESFGEPEYHYLDYPPVGIACGDLDNNGYDDIAICGSKTMLYFSNINGFDSLALEHNAGEIDMADFDSDGDLDIVTFSEIISVSLVYLYENKGNQLFVFDTINNFKVQEGISDMCISDFNNDSLNDIILMPFTDFTKYLLYLNHGDFDFSNPTEIPTSFYTGELRKYFNCSDLDGNGCMDIIASHNVYMIEYPGIADMLFNDGHGNFVENPLEGTEEIEFRKTVGFKNYPNPFRISTTFEFTIENESQIEISVYDLKGRLVKSITNKTMKGGTHKIKWGGLNNASQACKPDPHIAYLKVNGLFIQSIKLIIN